LVAITEFYTGTRWPPVKSISRASQTGHATNIIEGLAVGMQSTAAPVVVIAAGILLAHHFAGLYGIGIAVMAQLSMTGLIVAIGSAALAALVLFDSYTTGLHDQAKPGSGLAHTVFNLNDAWVIAGLLIGGLMPFLFASLAMEAVGRVGGQVVEEVRRQFREHP